MTAYPSTMLLQRLPKVMDEDARRDTLLSMVAVISLLVSGPRSDRTTLRAVDHEL